MIAEVAKRVRENIQKVIVGKGEVIDLALVAVLCEGHVLIEDVPGIGKTTLARSPRAWAALPPHPVHPGSAAIRRHWHQLLQPEGAGV